MSQPRIITYGGQARTMAEWDRVLGLRRGTIAARMRNGWTEERAVTTPRRPWVFRHGALSEQTVGETAR